MSPLVMNKSPTAHGEVFLFHWAGMLLFINQAGFMVKRIMNRSKTSWSQSFLFICHCLKTFLLAVLFVEARTLRIQHEWHFHIAPSIIIWSNLKQISSLCSLKICIHAHSLTASCHKGFISPSLHIFKTQNWKKKEKKRNPSPSHLSTDEIGSF